MLRALAKKLDTWRQCDTKRPRENIIWYRNNNFTRAEWVSASSLDNVRVIVILYVAACDLVIGRDSLTSYVIRVFWPHLKGWMQIKDKK